MRAWGARGKKEMGCFLDDLQSFRHQRGPVDDYSPERGGMAQDDGTRSRNAVVCPNVMGRTKERIAQSKRTRAGSLAIVD